MGRSMVSSHSQTLKSSCPECGADYAASESLAGKRCRCAKCGAAISIPAPEAFKLLDEINAPSPTTPHFRDPKYIGVECRVCQTQIYGTPDQVGKELKCPDCGAMSVLRPAAPVKKNIPAALEGEQYELDDAWDGGGAAAMTPFVPVVCVRCETLMQATVDQVGKSIKCPDCGKSNVVPPPPVVRPAPDVLASDGDDYELEEPQTPAAPPPIVRTSAGLMQFEIDEAAARADMSPAAVKRRAKLDARGRPILPRRPLVQGILPFLFSPGVPGWWVLLTIAYAACAFLILDALHFAPMGGQVTFMAMLSFLMGVLPGIALTAAAATSWFAIITESTDGHDEIQNWNTRNFSEWFTNLLYLVNAISASTLPGVLLSIALGKWIPTGMWSHLALGYATTVAALPLVVLSQLENNSAFGVFSGRIFATLGKCSGAWLVFYLETAVLLGACVAAGAIVALLNAHPLIPMPLYAGAFILYGRLLGRLGWVLSESVAPGE